MSVEAWEEISGDFVPCDINHLRRLVQSEKAFRDILNYVDTCMAIAAAKNQVFADVDLLQYVKDKGYDSWLFHKHMTFEEMCTAICLIYSKAGYKLYYIIQTDIGADCLPYEICEKYTFSGVFGIEISWSE